MKPTGRGQPLPKFQGEKMKAEDKELLDAYDDFAVAASTLLICMENRAGEDADCAEDYPFTEDFHEVSNKIRTWVFSADERLNKT